MEYNEVIGVIEDGFLHHSGWSGIVKKFVKWVVGSGFIISEV